jgi:hypothetical protein
MVSYILDVIRMTPQALTPDLFRLWGEGSETELCNFGDKAFMKSLHERMAIDRDLFLLPIYTRIIGVVNQCDYLTNMIFHPDNTRLKAIAVNSSYKQELMAKSCHPDRYFEWCLDSDEQVELQTFV